MTASFWIYTFSFIIEDRRGRGKKINNKENEKETEDGPISSTHSAMNDKLKTKIAKNLVCCVCFTSTVNRHAFAWVM